MSPRQPRRARPPRPRQAKEKPVEGSSASPRRSGVVALIGQPNAGKSTLLNRMAGEKLAIVSPKPQTTRNRILGVVTRGNAQVAFLDTPGIHEAKGELNRYMVEMALHAIEDVDLALLIIDAPAAARE